METKDDKHWVWAQDIPSSGYGCSSFSLAVGRRHLENVKEAPPVCGALEFHYLGQGFTYPNLRMTLVIGLG